jgi:predicted GNAT family acetyltransferase
MKVLMDAEVTNNTDQNRYEIHVEGRLVGVADYRVAGDVVVFPHTEITPSLRGKGLAAQLVRGALDDVRGSRRSVDAQCWYVAQFIDANPEYGDLLAA